MAPRKKITGNSTKSAQKPGKISKRKVQSPGKKMVKMNSVGTQVSPGDLEDLSARSKVAAFLQYVEQMMSEQQEDHSNLLISSHFNDSDNSDMSIHSDDDMYGVAYK